MMKKHKKKLKITILEEKGVGNKRKWLYGRISKIVITNIQDNWIRGYSLKDGMVFNNLDSRKFKRVVGYVDLKIG